MVSTIVMLLEAAIPVYTLCMILLPGLGGGSNWSAGPDLDYCEEPPESGSDELCLLQLIAGIIGT